MQKPLYARVFRVALRNNRVTDSLLASQEERDALAQCFKRGWLHATTEPGEVVYIFTTYLHHWFVEYYLEAMAPPSGSITDENLLALATRVIARFSRLQLSSPRRVGPSNLQRPSEAQFQGRVLPLLS